MVDDQGNDAMDWDEGVTPFQLRTLTRITDYYKKQEEGGPISEDDSLKNLDADMEDVIDVMKKADKSIQ
ncbi:MAG: hypothetical protein EXX96DRAFT_590511 [Benjaminiella poitrasii]|nr:MAG: hypothetical protein EXX96DRAFT_590511 [Benjaminiella poitrasii]